MWSQLWTGMFKTAWRAAVHLRHPLVKRGEKIQHLSVVVIAVKHGALLLIITFSPQKALVLTQATTLLGVGD